MIEVLTNFKCSDQTYFLSVDLMDRYFKLVQTPREVADLHITGVTCMFIASKFEDMYPLRMKMIFEKIAHQKIPIREIKDTEQKILKSIKFKISESPTSLEFLQSYHTQLLHSSPDSQLILKMSIYLAKMNNHDYELSQRRSSLLAASSLFVSLKICEQLRKT